MSTTYLTLANNVLQELNEVALTSTTFSSSRGIQTSVKNFVNKSVHDIYNEAGEIPALHTTASTTTGPTDDITGGGDYIYIEASAPRVPDDSAVLYSPFIDKSSLTNSKLTFYSHMYGTSIGTLKIDVSRRSNIGQTFDYYYY